LALYTGVYDLYGKKSCLLAERAKNSQSRPTSKLDR